MGLAKRIWWAEAEMLVVERGLMVRYLEPWASTESQDEAIGKAFRKQLEVEVARGHVLYGLPVQLIARGNGDDALFEILDGSSRVAEVHLTWKNGKESLPWPHTTVYSGVEEWAEKSMLPAHEEWLAGE